MLFPGQACGPGFDVVWTSYFYPVSFILGRVNASPSNTQGGSPVGKSRPLGSVRGWAFLPR